MVSHWYVNSGAAVKLSTKAFAELKADPKIGRAEALRRSMAELIRNGQPYQAHPAIWAPRGPHVRVVTANMEAEKG